jgi:hypothetical protein
MTVPCNALPPRLVFKSWLSWEKTMGEFHLLHWVVVFGVLGALTFVWGYPLAILCRRAGKSTAVGWLAGSPLGVFIGGPLGCIWWLALSTSKAPPPRS